MDSYIRVEVYRSNRISFEQQIIWEGAVRADKNNNSKPEIPIPVVGGLLGYVVAGAVAWKLTRRFLGRRQETDYNIAKERT